MWKPSPQSSVPLPAVCPAVAALLPPQTHTNMHTFIPPSGNLLLPQHARLPLQQQKQG